MIMHRTNILFIALIVYACSSHTLFAPPPTSPEIEPKSITSPASVARKFWYELENMVQRTNNDEKKREADRRASRSKPQRRRSEKDIIIPKAVINRLSLNMKN